MDDDATGKKHKKCKGWSLTSNAGRDDIFGKFLILPTTTFFPLVLSMVSQKKKK